MYELYDMWQFGEVADCVASLSRGITWVGFGPGNDVNGFKDLCDTLMKFNIYMRIYPSLVIHITMILTQPLGIRLINVK